MRGILPEARRSENYTRWQ